MASNLAAVGFAVTDVDHVKSLVSTAFDRAREAGDEIEHADGKTLRFLDPSGASVTIHVDRKDTFECFQPGFAGEARFRWRPQYVVPDADGCRFCDLVYADFLGDDGSDDEYYPIALTVETIGETRTLMPFGETGEVAFACLCHDGRVTADEGAFEREQEAEWSEAEGSALRFASKSLIPSGTFSFAEGGPLTSEIFANGIVESVEERHNELGGGRFLYVRLDTLGGTFDTCVAPGTLEREELLAPWAVVSATFTIIGRPLTLRDVPGPVPTAEQDEPKKIRRLFGRRNR